MQKIWAIMMLLLVACVEPYNFNTPDMGDRLIVVDGSLSDQPGDHLVRLSYTLPLDASYFDPLSGASLVLIDDQNNQTTYTEVLDGEYHLPEEFVGEVGKSYKLTIEADGKSYESEFIPLIAAPTIDSIYGKYAELISNDDNETIKGIQFFVDTQDDQIRYFRYEWSEAYRVAVPSPSYYGYDIETDSTFLREDQVGVCYQFGNSNELIFATSISNKEGLLTEFPVRFVNQESRRLRSRYALLVKQYAISEDAYNFYRRLKENNEFSGSLFDTQQGTIIGNIKSITDPEETVLGYFEVAGVSEKRAFFEPRDFEGPFSPSTWGQICLPNNSIQTITDSLSIYFGLDANLRIYNFNQLTGFWTLTDRICADCSWYATTEKPSYWED